MKWSRLFLFLFFLGSYAQAGGVVGNGGHSIQCEFSPSNRFNGYYNKDYLYSATANPGYSDSDLRPVSSWQGSLEQIGYVLSRHLPELSTGFESFRHSVFYKPDGKEIQGDVRWWIDVTDEFAQTESVEDFAPGPIPENCYFTHIKEVSGIIIKIKAVFPLKTVDRTVVLDQKDAKLTLYRYSSRLVDQLDPMNLSFLLVHEWLWDLSLNAKVNRKVNRFLHSKEFLRMNRLQLVRKLKALGLELP